MHSEHLNLLIDNLYKLDKLKCSGNLRKADGTMCIEGLACEVYRQHTEEGHWQIEWYPKHDGEMIPSVYFVLDGEFYGEMMPEDVAEWYGFSELKGDSDDINRNLIDWNDNENLTFKQMARKLETAHAAGEKIYF